MCYVLCDCLGKPMRTCMLCIDGEKRGGKESKKIEKNKKYKKVKNWSNFKVG